MPPHHQPSSNGFTSNLLETLQASRLELDEHVNRQKQYMDAQVVTYQNKLNTEQLMVQAQEKALETVRSERGVTSDTSEAGVSKRRHDLTVQQTELQERIRSLEEEQEKQTHVVEDLQLEERMHRSKAEEARHHKARVEDSKKTTIDDLTRGIINYKYLGFDFVKAPNKGNGLCFTFTHIDAGDHERTFSFILTANEEDAYVVDECDDLDDEALEPLLEKLNESDDLSAFMLGIRRAFSETV